MSTLFDVKRESLPYAHETIHKVKRTVRAILAIAKKQRLIQDNWASADYIEFPKKPKVEIEFLDDIDAKKLYTILQNSDNIKHKTSLMTLLLTGLRRGELCGLEWDDINFEQGTLTVERSVTTVKGYGLVEKEPKTESSKRTMSLPVNLLKQLKEYKKWQKELAESLGDRWINTNRLFTAEFGDKIHPSVIMSWLKKVCADNNLPPVTLHSLRHTNITLQIMAGVPLVIVSGRAGHARTSTTTDVYSHFLKSSDKEAAQKLNNLFG
jgi:integrase